MKKTPIKQRQSTLSRAREVIMGRFGVCDRRDQEFAEGVRLFADHYSGTMKMLAEESEHAS